ncbi:MAG TPA: hypothetical protein VF733_02415 [Candidatus Saccharimonadales bacterium]
MTALNESAQRPEGLVVTSTNWDQEAAIQMHPDVVVASFGTDYRSGLKDADLETADRFIQSRRHLIKSLEGDVSSIWDARTYGAEVVRGIASLCANRFVDLSSYAKQPAAALIRPLQASEELGAENGERYDIDILVQRHEDNETLLLWGMGKNFPNLKVSARGFVACRKQVAWDDINRGDKCEPVSATELPVVLQAWTERLDEPVGNFNPALTLESRLMVLRSLDRRWNRNYGVLSNFSSVR